MEKKYLLTLGFLAILIGEQRREMLFVKKRNRILFDKNILSILVVYFLRLKHNTMKKKNVAAIFALILGAFGVHRFYLGQVGLGILYLLLSVTGISTILGLVDAVLFFTMGQAEFDQKYNGNPYVRGTEERPQRRDNRDTRQFEQPRRRKDRHIDHRKTNPGRTAPRKAKNNPFKISGVEKYKEYEFEGAIADFKKALAIDDRDIAVHFNLACAYSITEDADQAFYHLGQAVEHGFVDFDKIQEHDALAYLRIQDEFEPFVKNRYRKAGDVSKEQNTPVPEISGDLLEQIKRLGELREKGFLTQDEFISEKRKLLR